MGTLLAMLCLITVNGRDLTYQIDYGGGILRPDYAEALRACPPDLLHVGIEGAPLPSYWFGTQAQPAPDPRGVRRRLETFRTLVASLHEVGVRTVMPYLCAITIGGDPEPPLGWFGFFQRWDEYAEFGLGPKPATGPLEWLQRRPDGQPMLYYAFDHYRPLHRYAVAPTNPHWQHFLATVARLMAEAGYDGVFVDNPNARDFGPDAQRALAAWAAALPAAERAAAWPAGPPTMAADGQSPAATLTRRFMAESEARLLAVIREGGVGGGRPAFQVNPNAAGWAARLYGHGHDLRAMAPAIALAMDEGATWPGVEQQGFAGLLTRQFARDNLFSYLRGQIPGRDPINCLATRGQMVSDAQLLLASAGAAAFGGLWVHRRLDDPRLDGWEQFAGFARAHRDLFEQLEPAAEVAVAWSTPDLLAGFTDHFGACEETARFLLREQIPLRLIELSDSTPAALRGYRVVVLPQVRCFDPAGLDLLQRYVEGGGTIVAIGPTATHDPLARASHTPGLATAPRIRNFATWPTSAAAWLAVRQALGAALPHGGSLVVEHDVPGLRLAHWRGDGGREVVHVLNYSLGASPGAPNPALPPFTLRLPDRHPAAARLLVPGAAPRALPLSGLTVEVPSIAVYGVLELTGCAPRRAPAGGSVAALKPDIRPLVPGHAPFPVPAVVATSPPSFGQGPTWWRFAQTMLAQAVGPQLRLVVTSRSVGYPDGCHIQVLDRQAKVVAEQTAALGETATLTAPATAGEVFMVLVDPGSNAVAVETDGPLTVIGASGVLNVMARVRPLYFRVPQEIARFTIRAMANSPNETATVVVRRPDGSEAGRLAGELDSEETLTLEVADTAPGLWRIELSDGPTGRLEDVRLTLDPALPPEVADHPARLLIPAG